MSAWKDAESLTRALAKSTTGEAAANAFRFKNATHRKVLESLDVKQLESLIARGIDTTLLETATWQIAGKNIEAALRIYDAMLCVPLDELPWNSPTNATYWLLLAEEKKLPCWTEKRGRAYLERWAATAKSCTLLYFNIAHLALLLGDKKAALDYLREGILEGDPKLATQLGDDDLAPVRAEALKLKSLEPVIPRPLRAMQLGLWIEPRTVGGLMMKLDFEGVTAHPDDSPADGYDLGAKGRERFRTFGNLPDGGDVAFWRRDPKAALAACPVVIFGSDGNLTVYARDFTGFLTLLAHSYRMHDAEGDGFHFEDTSWEAPKPSKLVANGLLAKAKKWDAGIAKRKAADELKAGYALVPEFLAEIHALRSGGKSEKKRR